MFDHRTSLVNGLYRRALPGLWEDIQFSPSTYQPVLPALALVNEHRATCRTPLCVRVRQMSPCRQSTSRFCMQPCVLP